MKEIINKTIIHQELNRFIDSYQSDQNFSKLITNVEEIIRKVTSANDVFILTINDFAQEINILSQDKKIFVEDMEETFSVILECYYTKHDHHAKNLVTSFLYNSAVDKLVDYPLKEILVVPLLDNEKNINAIIWASYSKENPEGFTQDDSENINYILSFLKDIPMDRTQPSTTKQKQEDEQDESQTLNILIVDDDTIILKFLSTVLKHADFHVVMAHSGIEALKIYKSSNHSFDLIFMDEVMNGGMFGHQVVKKIREIEAYNHEKKIPIIALTSDTSKDTRRLLLKAGVDMVLYKPIDSKRILEVIGQMSAN